MYIVQDCLYTVHRIYMYIVQDCLYTVHRIYMYIVQDLHVCLWMRQVSDEQCVVVLYSKTLLCKYAILLNES